jgi:hypothetical protein
VSRRYGRYLRLTKGRLLRIDAAKRRLEEQLDGKFMVHSNDDSLTSADLALGYKQLQRVEDACARSKVVCAYARSITGRCIASIPMWP